MQRLILLLVAIVAICFPSCIKIQSGVPQSTTPPNRDTVSTATPLRIEKPSSGERFLAGEPVLFKIRAANQPNSSSLQWNSSINGYLGSGAEVKVNKLATGSHQVTVGDGNNKAAIEIRVFDDLWQLYQSNLSPEEINRIMADFTINFADGKAADERWDTYDSFKFNQQSPDPSKAVALAKLDVLRRQRFSRPLPFTGQQTIYDYLRNYVKKINLNLGCGINTAGGGTLNLNRGFGVWDSRQSGSTEKPDACKFPLQQPPVLNEYTDSLYLLLHEARHCEPTDPGHVSCNNSSNMDKVFDGGSGHARAALYLMWVYKYGIYDPPQIREKAKTAAQSILNSRFCTPVKHSNKQVQMVLDELINN